ncbi:hypothetical protein [Parafrankia sp. EUN1f]|uniref:hypothetical protein n=1 Tax=Parafrankia sp. EUN1f TaxID=102897 RepID=UPI0001C47152|nr:hypothetical protein [Parafrankia sp. EUN1f]EFC79709.1 hypothetical protein FrEUN1fDRAFT_7179 [Parafrankia sp. EUN1f]
MLLATLAGIRDAGAQTTIDGADLTDRHMHVRVRSDSVRVLTPALLRDYRSPFTGERGADNPVVWAGFVLTNSEVGAGAFSITPRLVVQVCNNGLTIARDAMRQVHLGARLEEGTVSWSRDTQRKALALVTAKVRDSVAAFLTVDYVERQLTVVREAPLFPWTTRPAPSRSSAGSCITPPSSRPSSCGTSSRAAILPPVGCCTP